MSLEKITEIARQRYETGAYGHTHFIVSGTVVARMKEAKPPTPPILDQLPALLVGIPVFVNEDMAADAWKLVDITTGEVLHEGTL